jgi:hypothetical protein
MWIAKPGRPSLLRQTPEGCRPIRFIDNDILKRGDIVLVTAEVVLTKSPAGFEMILAPQEIIAIGHLSLVCIYFHVLTAHI